MIRNFTFYKKKKTQKTERCVITKKAALTNWIQSTFSSNKTTKQTQNSLNKNKKKKQTND